MGTTFKSSENTMVQMVLVFTCKSQTYIFHILKIYTAEMESAIIIELIYVISNLVFLYFFVSSTVVNAALRFYNSTTVISGRKDQSAVKKQVTKTLNVTADPEEKRRIIGDTFIKVRFA